MEIEKNPATKHGDKIMLIKSNNSQQNKEGHILTVTSSRKTASKANFTARSEEDGISINVYYTNPADEFIMATRENQITWIKEVIVKREKEIKELKEDLEFLEKYETEEDFVAAKLEALLTAHNKAKTPEARTQAIKEVLTVMKKSNQL